MAQCVVKKKGGEQCRGEAGTGKYCPLHRLKFQKKIRHGKYAQVEVALGVPPKYVRTYKEFLHSEKPFDLSRELALLRALYVELRDSIEENRPARAQAFIDYARGRFLRCLISMKMNPVVAEEVVGKFLVPILEDALAVCWDQKGLGLDLEEARELTGILEAVSKVAERMKKIQDNVTLSVNINAEMLTRFLVNVVFPSVPEASRREAIASRARQFSVTARRTVEVPALAVSTTTLPADGV